jgi:hypothetical protein
MGGKGDADVTGGCAGTLGFMRTTSATEAGEDAS